MAQKGMEATRLSEQQQKMWSIVSIAGGTFGSILWIAYTSLREGRDWGTAFLMIALPVCLAIFRKPIDRMLLPLLPMRRKVPRLLLVALGLAAPYLVAILLYRGGPLVSAFAAICVRLGPLAGIGNSIFALSSILTQYHYMRLTVVLGPLVAQPLDDALGALVLRRQDAPEWDRRLLGIGADDRRPGRQVAGFCRRNVASRSRNRRLGWRSRCEGYWPSYSRTAWGP